MNLKRKSAGKRSPQGESLGRRWNWWYGGFFILGAALTLLLRALPAIPLWFQAKEANKAQPAPAVPAPEWGRLEYTALKLDGPSQRLLAVDDTPPAPLDWYFEGMSEPQVEELFATCDLTTGQKQRLLDKSHWKFAAPHWIVSPPWELVRDLSPAARRTIYAVLRQSNRNQSQSRPFRFATNEFDGWLADCGLPKDKQELIRRLVYANGDTIYFADGAVLERVLSPAEKQQLEKTIVQTPTLLMRLRITPDSDIAALDRYWGQAGRGEAFRPFLESLAKVQGGSAISVSYFFPPFPRKHLYTYPDPKVDNPRADCFWTAMNFFKDVPDDRFCNWQYTTQVLRTEYTRVQSNWTFGDVLMLVDDQQKAVHMCVYVADNVVFTKNGADYRQPWVLMRMPEMLRHYAREKPLKMVGYRRAAPPAVSGLEEAVPMAHRPQRDSRSATGHST